MPSKIPAKNEAETDIVHPDEILPFSWDFAAEMGSAEEIQSQSVTISDSDGNNVTGTILKISAIEDGDANKSKVTFVIQNMVADERYEAEIEAVVGGSKKLVSTLIIPCEN